MSGSHTRQASLHRAWKAHWFTILYGEKHTHYSLRANVRNLYLYVGGHTNENVPRVGFVGRYHVFL